jgi:hypothetical protein
MFMWEQIRHQTPQSGICGRLLFFRPVFADCGQSPAARQDALFRQERSTGPATRQSCRSGGSAGGAGRPDWPSRCAGAAIAPDNNVTAPNTRNAYVGIGRWSGGRATAGRAILWARPESRIIHSAIVVTPVVGAVMTMITSGKSGADALPFKVRKRGERSSRTTCVVGGGALRDRYEPAAAFHASAVSCA